MAAKDIVMLISQISIGALVTFFAILLWSHTREVEWMLAIMGAIVSYVEVIIHTLSLLGVIAGGIYLVPGVIDLDLILKILPQILYGSAFIVHLVKLVKGIEY